MTLTTRCDPRRPHRAASSPPARQPDSAYDPPSDRSRPLPDWMPGCRSENAHQYVAILREHRERIRNIDEERSEGDALLQLYRDLLSGNYLAPFYEFQAGYGNFLTSALDRSRSYVSQRPSRIDRGAVDVPLPVAGP